MELERGVFDCQMVILKNNLYHLSSITFLRAICWFFYLARVFSHSIEIPDEDSRLVN